MTPIERAEAVLDTTALRVKFVGVCPACQFYVTDLHEGHWDDCTVPALSALVEEAKAMKAEIKMLRFRALGSFYRQGFDAGELAATQSKEGEGDD